MAKQSRKVTTTDHSRHSGCVMPCQLCSYRVVAEQRRDAWRIMYHHLRHHHSCEHSARLAANADKNRRPYRQRRG